MYMWSVIDTYMLLYPNCRLLSDSLHLLTLYFSTSYASSPSTTIIEDSVSKLVLLLPPACVQQGVNSLLQALTTEHNAILDKTVSVYVNVYVMYCECKCRWCIVSASVGASESRDWVRGNVHNAPRRHIGCVLRVTILHYRTRWE